MLQNLTYKKKNKILLVTGAILCLVIYVVAISETVELRNLCANLKTQVQLSEGGSQRVAVYERRLNVIENKLRLSQFQGKQEEVQQALLSTVTNYCQSNGLLLREFPSTILNEESDFVIQTNRFVVEGPFVKSLDLLYQLEQKKKLGKVSSVNFQIKKDYKTKTQTLATCVYVQNVKREKT